MRPSAAACLVAVHVPLLGGCFEAADASAERTAEARFAAPAPDESALDSLLSAAEEAYWSGEFPAARVGYEAALPLARQLGDVSAEAGILTSLGLAAWRVSDYPEARRLGEEALAFKLRLGLHDQLWRSYNALGLLAYEEGRYFDAIDLHGRALELAEAASDTTNLAKSWSNLGLAYTEVGEFAEARRLQGKALEAARAAGHPLLEGRVLNQLGLLEVRVGEPVVGARHLLEALALAREAEDPVNEENTLGQLGIAYAAMGEPGRAIAYLDSAVAVARAIESRQDEAADLEQLAAIYLGAGEFRRALRLYEEAKAINEALGLEDEMAADLRSEAEIYAALGNLETARNRVRAARDVHRRLGSQLEILADELVLAELAQADGDADAAARHLEEATRIAATLEARTVRVDLALTRARIADAAGDPGGALRALESVAEDLPAAGAEVEWEAHALAARAWAALGAPDSAVAAGLRAVEAVERVRGRFASGLLRTSYGSRREMPYLDLVRILLDEGRVEEAFEIADGVRGRALVEHLATARANGSATVRELAEEERKLLEEIDRLVRELDGRREDVPGVVADAEFEDDLLRLRQQLERTRSEYATALVRAEERQPEVLSLLAGRRPEGARVRQALRPGEALLEYLVTATSIISFVVDPAGVRSFEVPIQREDLTTRVRIARELTASREADPEAAGRALAGLYRLLIEPARSSGALDGVRTLIVVPHAELAYVPFAALPGPGGRYLARDVALLHLPSAAALPALRDGWPPTSRRPDAGAAVFAPFPRGLPATGAEARALRRVMPDAVLREGDGATEARLRKALREARIVHAATHGILNSLNPMFSRLEVARVSEAGEDDGRFEVHEIVGLPVRASLVFLSGCETGAGSRWTTTFGAGEDYTTLARAFLYAGAANVVATLWRVEDEGAAAFAEAFYRRLEASGPVEALAAAQRQMMDDPTYSARYYWAAYRVAGSGEMKGPAQEAGRLTVLERGS